jgi:hypothetical protein
VEAYRGDQPDVGTRALQYCVGSDDRVVRKAMSPAQGAAGLSAYDIGEGADDIDSNLEHAGSRITIVRQFPLARQAADEAVELGNGLATFPPSCASPGKRFASAIQTLAVYFRTANRGPRTPCHHRGGRSPRQSPGS